MSIEATRQAIIEDADNVAMRAQGYLPLYAAGPQLPLADPKPWFAVDLLPVLQERVATALGPSRRRCKSIGSARFTAG
jgi:hypothetical protein